MNTYKFAVREYGLPGISDRFIEVKARGGKSAERKLMQICGNRTWKYKLVSIDGVLIGGILLSEITAFFNAEEK